MSSEMIRGGALKNTFAALKNSSIASRKVFVSLRNYLSSLKKIFIVLKIRADILEKIAKSRKKLVRWKKR